MRWALQREELANARARLEQTEGSRRFDVGTDLMTDADGNLSTTASLVAGANDWGIEMSGSARSAASSTGPSSRMGVFRTFFSGRRERIAILDSLVRLESDRRRLEGENALLSEWKAVIAEKIEFDLTDSEIEARRESLSELEGVEAMLRKLLAEGEVPRSILNHVALMRSDNEIRIRQLEAQKRFRTDLVRSRYHVPDSLFLSLAPDSLAAVIRIPQAGEYAPYDYAIDSLSAESSRQNLKLAYLPSTGVNAGAGVALGDPDGRGGLGMYMKIGVDLSWFRHAAAPLISGARPIRPGENVLSTDLGGLEADAARLREEAAKLTQESLLKMRLGQVGSAFEISDMIQRRLVLRTQTKALEASKSQALLASIENIRQIQLALPVPG